MRHGGTHLVKPMFKRIIGKSQSGKGLTVLNMPIYKPTIVCTRHPMNRLVSAFRYKTVDRGLEPGTKKVDRMLADYIAYPKVKTGYAPVAFMHAWADRWMGLEDAYYFRFEDLCQEKHAIRILERIVELVGGTRSPDVDPRAIYREVYKGPGYTGSHSKWKQWFGKRAMAAWREADGPALLEKMGY